MVTPLRELSTDVQASSDPYAECRTCPARTGCPSGCYHSNRGSTGDPLKPPPAFCAMRRGALEIALEIEREIGDICPHWFEGPRRGRRPMSQGQRTPDWAEIRRLLQQCMATLQRVVNALPGGPPVQIQRPRGPVQGTATPRQQAGGTQETAT